MKWPVVSLGSVLSIQSGYAFKSEFFNEHGDGVPIIRIRDLAIGFSQTFYSGQFDNSFLVETGDMLIGMDGEFRCYRWKGPVSLLNQRVCRLQEFTKDVLPSYVFYIIKDYLLVIQERTDYLTVKHISPQQIKAIRIPLPTLSEQRRIVEILDQADALRKKRATADAKAARILPALFYRMFGDPATNPMEWPVERIDKFAEVTYGLSDRLDTETTADQGTRIITISNVTLEGSLNLTVKRYSLANEARRAKAQLKNLDLLLNWSNGSQEHVGKTAIWEDQIGPEVLHVSFLLKIRTDHQKCNPYYLWTLLNLLRAVGYFKRASRTQINTKFNASELSATRLQVPPISLQNQFAAWACQVRTTQANQSDSRGHTENLFQTLLHRAFSGDLTARWREAHMEELLEEMEHQTRDQIMTA